MTFYVSRLERESQDMIAYISGTISFVLFLIVLSYHIANHSAILCNTTRKKVEEQIRSRFSDTETEE